MRVRDKDETARIIASVIEKGNKIIRHRAGFYSVIPNPFRWLKSPRKQYYTDDWRWQG